MAGRAEFGRGSRGEDVGGAAVAGAGDEERLKRLRNLRGM